MNHQRILEIKDLRTYFFTYEGVAKAVDGVSYQLEKGEPLGVVGESGCGKSVTALSILRLIPMPPGKVVGGEILFKGRNLLELTEDEMRKIRGNRISMIFQEPMTSLNPVFTVGNQIQETFKLHQGLSKKEALEKSIERQRVMIAMALACNPEILIADEPTTALDVTIQAQILDLMNKLKEELGMAIILITHNLGVIAETVKRVIVMYAGKIVEEAETKTLFGNPQHPYTMGLLKSIPILGDKIRRGKVRLNEIPGVVPSLYELPSGCKFSTRCPSVMDICQEKEPELKEIETGHFSSCWLTNQ
jgi:peptide/nickel transport system ATP-binding protein/oligopeptide transport system ATP-binding protein